MSPIIENFLYNLIQTVQYVLYMPVIISTKLGESDYNITN